MATTIIPNTTSYLESFASLDNFLAHQRPIVPSVQKFVTPIWWVIGFVGNTLAFRIWIKKNMRNSSGFYLAVLAMSDLIFLLMNLLFELQNTWRVDVLYHPGICQAFPVIYMAIQYLCPLLVLAFTVERYISICHPFKSEVFCTMSRAVKVTIGLSIITLTLHSVQGKNYFLSLIFPSLSSFFYV